MKNRSEAKMNFKELKNRVCHSFDIKGKTDRDEIESILIWCLDCDSEGKFTEIELGNICDEIRTGDLFSADLQ